jgi:hypothetical protein
MQETDNHIKKVEVMAWQLHDVEVIIDANKCNSILYHAWECHLKLTNNQKSDQPKKEKSRAAQNLAGNRHH